MKTNRSLFCAVVSFFLFSNLIFGQFDKTDSIGNFYVIKNKLLWQKYYPLDDVNELNEHLKNNHFTSTLDILNYKTSAQSSISYIEGSNLPQYTSKGFKAFIIVDLIQDKYRITVQDITFPDFVEEWYYSYGRRDDVGGTLGYYILRRSDFEIKRNSGTYNVLETFDNSFEAAFNLNGE